MELDFPSSEDDGELSKRSESETESESEAEADSKSDSEFETEANVKAVEEKMKSTVNKPANVPDISEFPLLHSFFSSHPSCNIFDQLLNEIVKYSGGKCQKYMRWKYTEGSIISYS
jgi:hypothetical protein